MALRRDLADPRGTAPTTKTTFRLDGLKIEGESRAGFETWFRVHPPGLAFDVGRGPAELTGAERIFLTHGHLDHAVGLPLVLSSRRLQGGGGTRVYCPREIRSDLDRFIGAAAELEREEYDFEIIGLSAGERVDVGKDLAVEAFAVPHGVPALGYHLVRSVRKLAPEHRERSGPELAALRKEGVEVTEAHEETWVTYCGDTGAEIFDQEPRLFESKVLLLECTFLAEGDRVGAETHRHLHFEDFAGRRDRFRNEAILLHHLTRRHSVDELRRMVDDRLPELAPRIHLVH